MSKPLQRRFIALFAGIFVGIVLVMLLVLYLVADRLMERNIRESVVVRQTETDNGVHLIFNEINVAHARFVFHEDFAELVSDGLEEERRSALYEKIVSEVALADIFLDMALVLDGEVYSSYTGISFAQNFINEVSEANNLVTQANVIYAGDLACLPVGKRLTLYPVPDTVGCLVFLVDCRALGERCAPLAELGSSMLVRSDGYVIADTDSRFVGSKILDMQSMGAFDEPAYSVGNYGGKRSIVVMNPMQTVNSDYNLNWSVVSVLDYAALFASMQRLNVSILVIGLLALVGGGAFAWFSARRLSRPIKEFSEEIRGLQSVRDGGGIAEFDLLYEAYREMLERIDELLLSSQRDEEAKRKLELDSLQMQINPHFLYNTLDAISWMAKINKQAEIDRMVMGLAALFRISLHNGDKFITIREEMELVKNFLQIQEVRFPDKFVFEEEFSDEVAEKYTLKLLLQPIVENCVKHAIVGLDRVCRIKVTARQEGGDVVYEISDNGAGFDPHAVIGERVFSDPKKGGYGLKNINERIRLEYGEGYGLQIESAPHEGTRVTIRIKAMDRLIV